MELKYILIGLAIGLFLVLLGNVTLWAILCALGFILVLASFVDWSGQGDGRQGCNRHTNCNH